MNPAPSIRQAEQRFWTYWFSDGLPELVCGVGCLLFATWLFLPEARNGFVRWLVEFFFGLYLMMVLKFQEILEWLKSRITYPRSGYAAPPYWLEQSKSAADTAALSLQQAQATLDQPPEIERLRQERTRRRAILIVLGTILVVGLWLIENPWACVAAGLCASLILWWATHKGERVSWLEIIVLPLVGFYLFVFPVAPHDRINFFLLGGGAALVLTGAMRLVQYLRSNPAVRV